MNKLSKEKRNQLMMAAIGIVVVLVVLYMGLIRPQYDSLARTVNATNNKDADLQKQRKTMGLAVSNGAKLKEITDKLASAESDIASGDSYAWSYDLIRRFKANYKVEIPTVAEPTVQDVDILPDFPYRQIRLTVNGTAFYHDLGKFIADFENTYPHIRVTNLFVEPGGSATEPEKLSFHFEIVALVKADS
jgi:hypothetical protein